MCIYLGSVGVDMVSALNEILNARRNALGESSRQPLEMNGAFMRRNRNSHNWQ